MAQVSTAQPAARPGYNHGMIWLFGIVATATFTGTPLYGYFYGYTTTAWVLLAVLYVVTGLGITVGYHRLIAHKSFACPTVVKAALLIVGGWTLENSALVWASDHIRHHACCDEDEDPYNAQRGFWYSHCGWMFFKDPHADARYETRLRRDSVVMWQHRYYVPILASGLILPFTIGLLDGGWHGALGCFFLAGLGRIFLVLNSTFCINSICHLVGPQPHGSADSARDNWLVSLLTFGEGYHNYHHTYPNDYRNGPRWYNVDPSKWLVYLLWLFGLATSLERARPSRPS
jgi:stearoyl-CoA desaturase (Delta-9 desaturase)